MGYIYGSVVLHGHLDLLVKDNVQTVVYGWVERQKQSKPLCVRLVPIHADELCNLEFMYGINLCRYLQLMLRPHTDNIV